MDQVIRSKKNNEPCAQIKLSIRKKMPAVNTGQVIRSKKIACRAHRSSYPLEENCELCTQIKLSIQKIIIHAIG